MNKKLLITLGVSLALNFIFLGFEASRIYYQPSPHIPPIRPEFAPRPMPDGGAFNTPEQRMMQQSFKKAFKDHGKELKTAMQNVKAVLKNEPFDAEKFKEALQKAAEVRSTVDAAVQESMVETVSKMSPEERQRFAEQFGKGRNAFEHKKGHHNFRPGEPRMPCPCMKKAFHHGHKKHFQKPNPAEFHENAPVPAENDFSDAQEYPPRPPFAKHIKPKLNKKYMKGKPVEEEPAPVNEEE